MAQNLSGPSPVAAKCVGCFARAEPRPPWPSPYRAALLNRAFHDRGSVRLLRYHWRLGKHMTRWAHWAHIYDVSGDVLQPDAGNEGMRSLLGSHVFYCPSSSSHLAAKTESQVQLTQRIPLPS
jgi:hypothetical protein